MSTSTGEKQLVLLFYFIGLQNITIYTKLIQYKEWETKISLKSRNRHIVTPTTSCRATQPTTYFHATTSNVSCRGIEFSTATSQDDHVATRNFLEFHCVHAMSLMSQHQLLHATTWTIFFKFQLYRAARHPNLLIIFGKHKVYFLINRWCCFRHQPFYQYIIIRYEPYTITYYYY